MSSRLKAGGGKHIKARSSAFIDSGERAFVGLSEDERDFMAKTTMKGAPSRSWEATNPEDIKAQYSKLNEEHEKLKVEYGKLDARLKGMEADNKKIKTELETANKNLETNRQRNSDLRGELEEKKTTIQSLIDERDGFKSRLSDFESGKREIYDKDVEETIKKLKDKINELNDVKTRLENNLLEAEDTIESLGKDRKDLEDRCAYLQSEIDRKDAEAQSASVIARGRTTVVRTDARTLKFRSLEDGNYDMRLSGDRSYITVRADPNGRAHCWDGRVVIPRLGTFLDFSGRVEYEAEVSDDMIRIRLQGF